ncbi:MAG TPA: transglutaminase family protein [bacterium]|jgi:transglutaminase-like putative cysteine protease|nr:transglutaminase family protein [bacterium]
MIFKIRHALKLSYVTPAVLGPQSLRLRPREDGSQRVLDFHVELTPQPSLLSACLDEHGNVEARAWFIGDTPGLDVLAESTVETLRPNPFDFVLETDLGPLPWGRKVLEAHPALAPCLPEQDEPEAAALAQALAREGKGDPLAFVMRMNRWLHEKISYEKRPEGGAQAPAQTLHHGSGACRDLALLFCAAARAEGLAARFVSGYAEGDPERRLKDLHAWTEIFLPGAGWRGFDPSSGLACADRHITLSASPDPSGAAVLSGRYGAAVAGSRLEAEVMFV